MAKVYFITGSLGSGKTLAGLDMVRKYLIEGRRVATNVNLHLEHLCSADNKYSRVIRVPDAPEINDLRAIGYGSDSSDDATHGLLLLDELGTWFNSRDFASKGRLEVIKWMIHMRKRRWDVAFIVQDFGMVDKQARGNIAQYLVSCQNSKTMWLFKLLPKFHVATVRMTATKMITDRWFYRGTDLYNAYDTEQLFHTGDDDSIVDADAEMSIAEKRSKAKNGLYCLLPPGYFSAAEKQQISDRFSDINNRHRTILAAAACFVLVVVASIFWPGTQDASAVETEPEPDSAQIQSQPSDSIPAPTDRVIVELQGVQQYSGWRVRSYSYIGGRLVRSDFTDGIRTRSMEDLISEGLRVSYPMSRTIKVSDDRGEFVLLHYR